MFRTMLIGVVLLSFTGCATVFDGRHQDFTVATYSDNTPKTTQCVLKNEEGEWRVLANTPVSIHRDGNTMKIQCDNEEQTGSTQISPRFRVEYLILDIVWDACILTASCIIDGITNAFYEYPESTSVDMKTKQQISSAAH